MTSEQEKNIWFTELARILANNPKPAIYFNDCKKLTLKARIKAFIREHLKLKS